MVNEYKRIVLLKGLTPISDDHFSLFKSLMASDLRLERNMQEQYTRVQIADMMEEEFPDDAGLSKLIKFCEDLQALRRHAGFLKKERSEGNKEQRNPCPCQWLTISTLFITLRSTHSCHISGLHTKDHGHIGPLDWLLRKFLFQWMLEFKENIWCVY